MIEIEPNRLQAIHGIYMGCWWIFCIVLILLLGKFGGDRWGND